MLIPCLSCLAALPLLIWLMRAEDPPKGTWIRFVISLASIWIIANNWQHRARFENVRGQIAGILLFVMLIFLWMPYYGRRIATAFTRFIHSIPEKRGAFRPDYQEAQSAAESGNLPLAMQLIREELEKDPTNFEGLMLLVSGQQAMQEPEQAMVTLKKILDNPHATPEQKRLAEIAHIECLNLQQKLAIQGRPPREIQ